MDFNVKLKTPDGEMEGRVSVPDGDARLEELVPPMQDITEGIVHLAVLQAEKAGERVTCRAGCGACCAQLVPISDPEAFAIADLIADMPAERRERVLARFAGVYAALEEAGLLETLWDPPDSDAGQNEMARNYFELGRFCPFLENESCGIHPDRPVACREYNALTPAELCAKAFDNPVRIVPVPVKAATALARVAGSLNNSGPVLIPLTLALEWVRRNPGRRNVTRPGRELLKSLLEELKNAMPPIH